MGSSTLYEERCGTPSQVLRPLLPKSLHAYCIRCPHSRAHSSRCPCTVWKARAAEACRTQVTWHSTERFSLSVSTWLPGTPDRGSWLPPLTKLVYLAKSM